MIRADRSTTYPPDGLLARDRYRGLRGGQVISLGAESAGLLVKPEVARRQLEAETRAPGPPIGPTAGLEPVGGVTSGATPGTTGTSVGGIVTARRPRRFHGTVRLDPARVGRDASRIADEVIAHLAGQVDADVTVTLEIDASLPRVPRSRWCAP